MSIITSRRTFLKSIAGISATFMLDPEKLLWVPGEKTIFLPPEKRLVSATEVLASELDHFMDMVQHLFDRDDLFYEALNRGRVDEDVFRGRFAKVRVDIVERGR